ncbi:MULTISPECIES: [NiFe]-hydrogenase assembly chaperone HybE [unclassified Halomonas]|uniref:[NiFe]-hydrogenase assembly chaperone HybE n=1 Tax=unclassified Halomonas TaxID=2609666 RepID=UPI0028838A29|nr:MULTISPECIES: [NiFe]-hydrogenase assembly chaperone HybE [unclassified Halomonas]MDT0499768.1 [NiFe]-hydrogenase assembly chaperone HybE [Halomonas sp. PAR7]MDT0510415.1 [NiFe]-hydrogenase assembly chaperone HybE [Halomonas sp. LES1]MDT0589876.1 [NiFe]-hydrogenase assembly chaperone HybE [Halomonas sp. PAR8]
MHALTPEQYQRLRRLAEAWTATHLRESKSLPQFNPLLAADALCFQCYRLPEHGEQLVGALVTPVSLWLVMLPDRADAPRPEAGERCTLTLPSGRYPMEAVALGNEVVCWRLVLLDDLTDVASRQDASRLAQRLMERVMTREAAASSPPEPQE